MTVCENSYPKGLALNYLDELQKEFDIQNGHEVQSARRPYAFVKFGMIIHWQCLLSVLSNSDWYRHVYTKNKETLRRHQITKKPRQNRRRAQRCKKDHDTKHSRHSHSRRAHEKYAWSHSFDPIIRDLLLDAEVREKSEDLLADSAKYKRDAKFLHTQLFWRKWSPVATAVAIVCFFAGVTVIF